MRVSFHKAAHTEMEDAVGFYSSVSPGLGRAFRDEVAAALDRIVEHPAIGFPVRSEFRRYLLKRFPYSLLYQTTEDRLRIVAVMHDRRKPGYWHDRIEVKERLRGDR